MPELFGLTRVWIKAREPETRAKCQRDARNDSDRGNSKAQEGPLNNFSEQQGLRRF